MIASPESTPVVRQVNYGSERIDFLLSRRPRKTLAITVHPDLRVEVVAPLFADEAAVIERVQARARWILRQRRQFSILDAQADASALPVRRNPPIPRSPISPPDRAERDDRSFKFKEVSSKSTNHHPRIPPRHENNSTPGSAIKPSDVFAGSSPRHSNGWFLYQLPQPTLRLLRMPKRWGSCTPKGEILLNPELIKAPGICVEYVILHELCHLKHPNHSAAFFRMLDAVLPDWRERKQRLERAEI